MQDLFPRIGSSVTLSQEIMQKIEEVILNKKILPGEKLPTENEMCRMFGVSRTALREALQMLNARGLINIRKGSGIYVNNYSSAHVIRPMSLFLELNLDRDYILHVMEVRKMFEPQIARLAANQRTAEDLQKIETSLVELEKCPANNYAEQGELDRDFHLAIANACRNPIIPVIVTPIFKLMPKIRSLVYANIPTAQSAAVDYHRKIFERIRSSDSDGAYQMMVAHLVIAEEHTQKIIEG